MLLVLHSPVRFLDPTKEDHMRGVQHIVRRRRRQHLDRSVLMMAVAFLLCYMFLLALSILPIASAFVFTSHDFRTSLIIQQHRSPSVGHRVPPLAQLSARGATTITRKSTGWYPKTITYDDDIFSEEDATAELEERVIQLAANLVRHRLFDKSQSADKTKPKPKILSDASVKEKTIDLVKGRFMDLTCTQAGEEALERLFWEQEDPLADLWVAAKETAAVWTNIDQDDVIRCAAMVIQSLCVLGTQVGVKGQPEQLRRMVEHLANDQNKNDNTHHDFEKWTADSVRRLKFKLDRTPAQQLLAELRWKKTPQSAFDLLVALGAWEKHEDLALLRSGFPIRFTEQEEKAAADAMQKVKDGRENVDPDAILGLRQDLRHLKVYTVDSESTAEIDDGISLEAILANHEGGREERRQRIWIHIADAERWASPHSELFESARRRITSLYLPSGSISMFPSIVGTELMSLQANRDVCALSLGVELNDDGSIIESSLIVTPSLIRVSYRLTYDEVDEMLEEGIGYNEEWELGALLAEATKRREFRILNGSTEGMVPNPVPYAVVSIFSDETAPDSVGISVDVQMSHNAARNKTATAEDGADASTGSVLEEPVSSAYLLVTETMILAGEAIGRWKGIVDAEDKLMPEEPSINENLLRLPFRTQRQPGKCYCDGIVRVPLVALFAHIHLSARAHV